jgi:hypothetical protein
LERDFEFCWGETGIVLPPGFCGGGYLTWRALTSQSRHIFEEVSVITKAQIFFWNAISVIAISPVSWGWAQETSTSLRESLSLYASFDAGVDADFARGNKTLWTAPKINQREQATAGVPSSGEVRLDPHVGKFGGSMSFSKSKGPMVFYQGEKNVPMPQQDWSCSLSFWLRTDPLNDLQEGFCDPIQLTSKQWDDAAIFVEFEKRATGIPFRLGVYADKSVWNPTGRKFETIPASERPLVTVSNPPFRGDRWTHVAVVLSHFNTGKADGESSLFLDGKLVGAISERTQTFTWVQDRVALMLGLSYVGFMDELMVFDRALSANDVQQILALDNGGHDLVRP